MAFIDEYWCRNTLEFSLGDVTGAIGDLSTVFSVIIAVAALTDLTLAPLLLETGIRLSLDGVGLALLSVGVAAVVIVAGYRKASALVVLCVGVVDTLVQVGLPAPQLPPVTVVFRVRDSRSENYERRR